MQRKPYARGGERRLDCGSLLLRRPGLQCWMPGHSQLFLLPSPPAHASHFSLDENRLLEKNSEPSQTQVPIVFSSLSLQKRFALVRWVKRYCSLTHHSHLRCSRGELAGKWRGQAPELALRLGSSFSGKHRISRWDLRPRDCLNGCCYLLRARGACVKVPPQREPQSEITKRSKTGLACAAMASSHRSAAVGLLARVRFLHCTQA